MKLPERSVLAIGPELQQLIQKLEVDGCGWHRLTFDFRRTPDSEVSMVASVKLSPLTPAEFYKGEQ